MTNNTGESKPHVINTQYVSYFIYAKPKMSEFACRCCLVTTFLTFDRLSTDTFRAGLQDTMTNNIWESRPHVTSPQYVTQFVCMIMKMGKFAGSCSFVIAFLTLDRLFTDRFAAFWHDVKAINRWEIEASCDELTVCFTVDMTDSENR